MSLPARQIQVYRDNKWMTIGTYELLPGDICSIGKESAECIAPADMLLLSGSCVVNEAMLTGESTPHIKVCTAAVHAHVLMACRNQFSTDQNKMY
jgi:cation-transporting ATPase 13A1